MNAKERLLRIIRAQNSLLKAKNHLKLAQNSIRKEYDLCVQEAADADGFVADCDERIERAGSWDGAQPDAFFGRSIKWRRCDSRDFGRLVRVSLDPIADPLQQPEAKLIGIDYGPDGDIEAFQCEGSKGQAVHWNAAWVQLQDGEELEAPPNGRRFTRIHMEGVDFSTGSQPKDGSLWDVIAEKWHIKPLDLVYLVAPPKWAQWPTWSTLHDLVLRNHRFLIDPEAEAKVSEAGDIAIKILGLWVNVDWLHVDHSFRAKAAQLVCKDYSSVANPQHDGTIAQSLITEIGAGYRRATDADIGKHCEFSDGSTNADGSLVWGIFAELEAIMFPKSGSLVRYYSAEGSFYDCRIQVGG